MLLKHLTVYEWSANRFTVNIMERTIVNNGER